MKPKRIRNKKAYEVAKATQGIPSEDRPEWMRLWRANLKGSKAS